MFSVQFQRKILFTLLYLLGLTAPTGCTFRSNRFGIILISNEVSGPTDIYRIPDNTQSKVEQLTFTPTIGEYYLLMSKNGDKIVFEVGDTGLKEDPSESMVEKRENIYLLDTASKELKNITDIFTVPPQIRPPQVADWSPNQKQFAVITHDGDLKFMDFDGTNKEVIPVPSVGEIPSNIIWVKWSPDGKKLSLTRNVVGVDQQLQNPGDALQVYDIGSGKVIQLASYAENCLLPIWSPTSTQIAATCSYVLPHTEIPVPDAIRIFSTENPGQPYERLTFSPCYDPSWSPDGKQLAFICDKDTKQAGLFIINSDGNGIREVKLGNLENLSILRNPIWSPDGTQIIYMAGTDIEHANIYSIHPDGSANHPLTNQEGYYSIVSVYPLP